MISREKEKRQGKMGTTKGKVKRRRKGINKNIKEKMEKMKK